MGSWDEIERMIQENHLDEKFEEASQKTTDIKQQILKIIDDYQGSSICYSTKCEATAQQLLMVILKAKELRNIHSARYRVKEVNSLVGKFIKKKAILPNKPGSDYAIEKYRPMDSGNYHKIITDLIGIRILIRYQQQWETVHNWIWNKFHKPEREYIKNWLIDYPSGERMDFIVEKPKVYVRDNKERPLYEKVGKDVFDIHESNVGYSSLHYLIWYDGKYVEIQVRTIYDEAWSECTHDLVYKCKDKRNKYELETMSACLATQTQAAGMLASMMYDKAELTLKKNEQEDTFRRSGDLPEQQSEKFTKLEERIQKLDNLKKDVLDFDGSIDDLINMESEREND